MKKILSFLCGLIIIFSILYLSKFILIKLHIVFPSPILGIIILFFLLKTKVLKEELIEDFCNFILKYMILFFIPIFVGTIAYLDILTKNFWAIILTIFITTTLVILSVGYFTYHTTKYKRLYDFKKGNQN